MQSNPARAVAARLLQRYPCTRGKRYRLTQLLTYWVNPPVTPRNRPIFRPSSAQRWALFDRSAFFCGVCGAVCANDAEQTGARSKIISAIVLTISASHGRKPFTAAGPEVFGLRLNVLGGTSSPNNQPAPWTSTEWQFYRLLRAPIIPPELNYRR
jgi:hypothetical protein